MLYDTLLVKTPKSWAEISAISTKTQIILLNQERSVSSQIKRKPAIIIQRAQKWKSLWINELLKYMVIHVHNIYRCYFFPKPI